ncbi:MAG: hypothetical protein OZ921_04270 [Sorangiineae bacterium]|nr:hypothetical protein [Sorangiineae bacterium]
MVIVVSPRFSFLALLFVGLAVRLSKHLCQRSNASSESEPCPEQGQPTVRFELLVEPPTCEQPEKNAQRELESD